MRIKFKTSIKELNGILKEENKDIFNEFNGGIEGNKRHGKLSKIIIGFEAIIMIIVGMMFSLDGDNVGYILVLLGLSIFIHRLIMYFKDSDKGLNIINEARGQNIIARQRVIFEECLGSSNYNEVKDREISCDLNITEDFYIFSFGEVDKIYKRSDLKEFSIEDEYLKLDFGWIKYYINKKYLKDRKEILKVLGEEKREVNITVEIKEEINIKKYIDKKKNKVDTVEMAKKAGKAFARRELYEIVVVLIGLIIVFNEMNLEKAKIPILFILALIFLRGLKNKGEERLVNASKNLNKLQSDLTGNGIRVRVGKENTFLEVSNEITVLKNSNLEIIKDRGISLIYKGKEILVMEEKAYKTEVLTSFRVKVYEDEKNFHGVELKKVLGNLIIGPKTHIFYGVLIALIIVFGKTKIIGVGFVLLGYLIVLGGATIFLKNLVKIVDFLKTGRNTTYEKTTEELLKEAGISKEEYSKRAFRYVDVKVLEDVVEIRESFTSRIIYVNSKDIKIRNEYVALNSIFIDINKIENKDLEVLRNFKEKNLLENTKEILFKGEVDKEVRSIFNTNYIKAFKKMTGIATLGFLISQVGIGYSISKLMGIGLSIGSILVYIFVLPIAFKEVKTDGTEEKEIYMGDGLLGIETENIAYPIESLKWNKEDNTIVTKISNEVVVGIDPEQIDLEALRQIKEKLEEK